MLSRAKIKAGAARYYAEQVADGLEDYMMGAGEAPGTWEGAGARSEGLTGEVTAAHIENLFEGADARHPLTGEVLGRRYEVGDGHDKVMGWDLTISAPKSFSALWAVADPDLAKVLDEIHSAAVREAIDYLEEHAAFSRTGRGGVAQVDTRGLVIARYDHRISRAMDPQRHSHLLVSNRVRCDDGVWRSLDSRALHPQLKPAGTIYHAALRAEATARLGLRWGPVNQHGQADITGVPDGLIRFWSTRRQNVEQAATTRITAREAELGRALTNGERRELYQRATLDTRVAKRRGEALPANIHDLWRLDAQAAGYAASDWVDATLDRTAPTVRGSDPADVVEVALAALDAGHSTWDRTDAVEQVAAHLPLGLASGASDARRWVEQLVGDLLRHPAVVRLAEEYVPKSANFERRDGRSVFVNHNVSRYTTTATLDREQHVLDFAMGGRGAGRGVCLAAGVEACIEMDALPADQAAAVRRLTRGGDALVCLVGPAGSGKTRTIATAANAWRDHGWSVRGLAVSAVAAGVLSESAGIEADTVAKLLYEHRRPEGPNGRWQLRPGEVVVVDEASQLATADLTRLVDLTRTAGGKLVLVGDHRQLGAVDAGGLFRLLAHDDAELSGVARFTHEWERDASPRLRDRDAKVLDTYERHDRLRGGPREGMLDVAYDAWCDARTRNVSMVVMARDHATVDALAMRIRAHRVAAHEVEPAGLVVGGQTVGVGDEIVTLRNDRRLVTSNDHWVRNGDRWRVERRDRRGALRLESLHGRGRVQLPSGYAAEHVALAYAVTLHKAQGITVDHGVVIADGGTSDVGLYVGMTRGRHANHALVATDYDQPEHQRWPTLPHPREILGRVLQRDTSERSATEAFHDAALPADDNSAARIDYILGKLRQSGTSDAEIEDVLDADHSLGSLFQSIARVVEGMADGAAVANSLRPPSQREPEPAGPEIDLGPDLW